MSAAHRYVAWWLLEDLPHQPDVAERIDDGPLKHARNGPRSNRRVDMFDHWIAVDGTGCDRRAVDRDGIVDEELDSNRRETHGGGPARAMRGGFTRQKEWRTVYRQAGNHVPVADVPENGRAERGLVERDRRVPRR